MVNVEEWEKRLRKKPGVTCFPYELKVIIPDRCGPGCLAAYRDLRKGLTRMFGGATVYDAEGSWVDNKGKVVPDHVKVIESAHSCIDRDKERQLVKMVEDAAEEADQDAIAIKAGQFMIIPRKAR